MFNSSGKEATEATALYTAERETHYYTKSKAASEEIQHHQASLFSDMAVDSTVIPHSAETQMEIEDLYRGTTRKPLRGRHAAEYFKALQTKLFETVVTARRP